MGKHPRACSLSSTGATGDPPATPSCGAFRTVLMRLKRRGFFRSRSALTLQKSRATYVRRRVTRTRSFPTPVQMLFAVTTLLTPAQAKAAVTSPGRPSFCLTPQVRCAGSTSRRITGFARGRNRSSRRRRRYNNGMPATTVVCVLRPICSRGVVPNRRWPGRPGGISRRGSERK